MGDYIVKVTHTENQTRITIPIMLAEETGLRYVDVVRMSKLTRDTIKVEEYHGKERGKRAL